MVGRAARFAAPDSPRFMIGVATGAPDLVIEIVSPDNGFHHRWRTFDLYKATGVLEF